MPAPMVVLLAGGGGTRIRHLLPGLPKPLAPVAGRPFLEWQIRFLRRQGLGRIVISAGYLSEQVVEFSRQQGLTCVAEAEPLGTAGGFLHAIAEAKGDEKAFLVCNGDSLVLADFVPLLEGLGDSAMDAALLAVSVPEASRFGALDVDTLGRLHRFAEKRPGAGLVSAGVYLFREGLLARFPARRPLSFEYDVFPALLAQGVGIRVVSCEAPFLDIGTEATLAQADAFVARHREWFA